MEYKYDFSVSSGLATQYVTGTGMTTNGQWVGAPPNFSVKTRTIDSNSAATLTGTLTFRATPQPINGNVYLGPAAFKYYPNFSSQFNSSGSNGVEGFTCPAPTGVSYAGPYLVQVLNSGQQVSKTLSISMTDTDARPNYRYDPTFSFAPSFILDTRMATIQLSYPGSTGYPGRFAKNVVATPSTMYQTIFGKSIPFLFQSTWEPKLRNLNDPGNINLDVGLPIADIGGNPYRNTSVTATPDVTQQKLINPIRTESYSLAETLYGHSVSGTLPSIGLFGNLSWDMNSLQTVAVNPKDNYESLDFSDNDGHKTHVFKLTYSWSDGVTAIANTTVKYHSARDYYDIEDAYASPDAVGDYYSVPELVAGTTTLGKVCGDGYWTHQAGKSATWVEHNGTAAAGVYVGLLVVSYVADISIIKIIANVAMQAWDGPLTTTSVSLPGWEPTQLPSPSPEPDISWYPEINDYYRIRAANQQFGVDPYSRIVWSLRSTPRQTTRGWRFSTWNSDGFVAPGLLVKTYDKPLAYCKPFSFALRDATP